MAVHESIGPYCLFYILPIIGVLSLWTLGIWSYGGAMFAFGVIPFFDLIIPEDTTNPTKEQGKRLSKEFRFKLIPALWVPAQYGLVFFAAHVFNSPGLMIYERVGIVVSVGILAGAIGINVAHELIHKPTWWEKLLGRVLLAGVCYGHWADEHLYGHHRLVSTPLDPATSRFGESFYAFWPRTVKGTWDSAVALESRRLRDLSGWRRLWEDMVFRSCLSSLTVAMIFFAIWGWGGLGFFCAQAPIAFTMLELVNYIEHYGLAREKRPGAPSIEELQAEKLRGNYSKISSSFEPVSPFHSWNAGHTVTNYFLLKLQRHSDHHANGGRRYQVLRSFVASPQLPTGYAGCILLALFPPLWFRILDPKVAKYKSLMKSIKKAGIDVFTEEFDEMARTVGGLDVALERAKQKKKTS